MSGVNLQFGLSDDVMALLERFAPPPPDTRLDQVLALLRQIHQELHTMSQSAQEHADALTAQVAAMDAALQGGIAAIQAEIAALKAANAAVDFAPLDAAVTALGTDVAAAVAIPDAP